MSQPEIQAYFDARAKDWDRQQTPVPAHRIFSLAGIQGGDRVLDVACGTGILFPHYRRHDILDVTAVDLSPQMVRIAQDKAPDFTVLQGDAATMDLPGLFDAILIYNAFPHFLDPEKLLSHLSGYLKKGGTLTVAHGCGRTFLNAHHRFSAPNVSLELPPPEVLAELFSRYLAVEKALEEDSFYFVSGRKL